MKKVLLGIIVLLFTSTAYGQVLILNSPETLAVPTADKLFLKQVQIDVQGQSIMVMYQFLDVENKAIPMSGTATTNRTWYCVNRPAQLVENCVAEFDPYLGCTGPGTGANLDPGSTCFTDTFSFAIRSQDVGVQIGKGLRALIWNKMRPSVLTGTNDATLP